MKEDVEQEKNEMKPCLGSFSLIKGFSICVIILGHIARTFNVSKLTWFHPVFAVLSLVKTPFIPLFFIISGYGFKKGAPQVVLQKTVKSLVAPYFLVMSAVCILMTGSVWFHTNDLAWALRTTAPVLWGFLLGIPKIGKVLFGYKLSNCPVVWFLLALFWAQNIMNMILKRKRLIEQILLVVGCAALGYFLCIWELDFFCIPQGLIAVTYCYVGYVLKKTKIIERGVPHKWMYPVWIGVSLLYASWGKFDLNVGGFAFFPMDYVGVTFLSLLILKIGLYLEKLSWKILDIFKYAGIYSYWILCLHCVEQNCLPWRHFAQLTKDYSNEVFILALIIKVVIISSGCMIIKQIIKRAYRKKRRNYVRQKLYSGSN